MGPSGSAPLCVRPDGLDLREDTPVISMKYAAWIVGLSALTYVGLQKYAAQKG